MEINEANCSICHFNPCICQSFWKDFNSLLHGTHFQNEKYEVSPLFISTMTVNFEIDGNIELEPFAEKCESLNKVKAVKFSKGGRKSKDQNVNKNFYNQCELHLETKPITVMEKSRGKQEFLFKEVQKQCNIKVAVFKNGSIKIVGCRTLYQVCRTIRYMHKVFTKFQNLLNLNRSIEIDGQKIVQKGFRKKGKKIEIRNTRMSLINCTFYIREGIDREALVDYLEEKRDPRIKSVLLDTERHEAVNIKFLSRGIDSTRKTITRKKTEKQDGEYTIMAFVTGAVIITGAQSIYDMVKGYNFINETLCTNSERLQGDE
jgi:TATA-box binding protein (TBP) (component of TFIID and TFIIIB)